MEVLFMYAVCPNLDKSQGNCNGLPDKSGGLPLAVLKAGEAGVVVGFNGQEEFCVRMMALGMIPGQTVTVVNGGREQPYLVRVAASRVMLDWQTLNHIYIRPVCNCRKRERKMRWWNA
jgi:Fe2+ transport system protein FeoA